MFEEFVIRENFKTGLIEKGIKISNILFDFNKMTVYPARICSMMESAHKDLRTIISEFASPNLHYQKYPSATSQLMLTAAPLVFMIARAWPYLEQETD